MIIPQKPWREALPDPPQPKGLQPTFSLFVFLGFFLTYAHIQLCLNQNLTISLVCGQVCTVNLLHVLTQTKASATTTAILNPSSFI